MRKIFIAHVCQLIFHKDIYRHSIYDSKKGQDFSLFGEKMLLDNLQSTVGETFEQVQQQLSTEVRDFLSRHGLDPTDFSFEFKYTGTENGMFWPASTFSVIRL
jgi:hypothetical protein